MGLITSAVKLLNTLENEIDPATEDKQDDIIAAFDGKATEAKQDNIILAINELPDENYTVQKVNPLGSLIYPANQGNQEELNNKIDEAYIENFYYQQDFDYLTSSTVYYEGRVRTDGSGKFLIIKYDRTGATESMRYAGNSNNSSVANYVDAFTQRAGLTYDYLYNLTSL